MTVNDMREAIADVYKGRAWRRKVDRMSDSQVIAVYHSFKAKGKFDGEEKLTFEYPPNSKPIGKVKNVVEINGGVQLTIF